VIAVVDYGAGNITSVVKALEAVGAAVRVVSRPDQAEGADALVIPGVGHFAATGPLHERWQRPIRKAIDSEMPVLGICLGMQWLFEGSDEAPGASGLGIFQGRCFRLPDAVKVPHVGWNTVDAGDAASTLLADLRDGASAYFAHSFAAPSGPCTLATTTHGARFAAAVARGSVYGVQFHPEKSGRTGLKLLANFVAITREKRSPCSPAA